VSKLPSISPLNNPTNGAVNLEWTHEWVKSFRFKGSLYQKSSYQVGYYYFLRENAQMWKELTLEGEIIKKCEFKKKNNI